MYMLKIKKRRTASNDDYVILSGVYSTAISYFIFAIASAGFKLFGHVREPTRAEGQLRKDSWRETRGNAGRRKEIGAEVSTYS